MRVPTPIPNLNENPVLGYGRTHSLPTNKNGPYTCPKCRHVYQTAQAFAAHIGSHYKSESKAERKKRRANIYKKRCLRLVQSSDGLTVVPASLRMEGVRNGGGIGNADATSDHNEAFNQDQDVQGIPVKKDFASAGIKIEKESV
ncbi:hypothetical protein CFOL_v3_08856 [Cephalotus follicularis]|uniref:C2H2-type domain-containing protein n=1 Tax=Cephalotus follicularis TaxID=3775 RepID=A0A1Q3BBF0_CEPFO|nr:hypothetical protein CFOL_v3_08856 [Cephalotus follicularis]